MSKDRVVDYVNNLAETGEQSEDGNFGYGTKVSAYARNKEGIAYQLLGMMANQRVAL